MAATRTQIYITQDQRRRLDQLRKVERKPLAEVIRDAIDAYLQSREAEDLDAHFERTAGTMPELVVPSRDEWDRRGRWAQQ